MSVRDKLFDISTVAVYSDVDYNSESVSQQVEEKFGSLIDLVIQVMWSFNGRASSVRDEVTRSLVDRVRDVMSEGLSNSTRPDGIDRDIEPYLNKLADTIITEYSTPLHADKDRALWFDFYKYAYLNCMDNGWYRKMYANEITQLVEKNLPFIGHWNCHGNEAKFRKEILNIAQLTLQKMIRQSIELVEGELE
jgi:hypothetical protein